MATPELSPAAQAEILNIAQRILYLPHLEETSTGKDFKEQAVWSIKAALEAAYLAGMADHHRKRG